MPEAVRDIFGEFVWRVRSYECAPSGELTLANLCNYFQEAASLNVADLGFSKTDFEAAGSDTTWVMTRMKVRVERYPEWGENVRILTFPRAARRISACRDFLAYGGDGGEIAKAATEWLVIDMSTRRPRPIPAFVGDKANTARRPVFGEEPFTAKLRWPADTPPAAPPFRTVALKSDIDLNAHVNNVRYIAWLMESAPAGRTCRELELVFRGETRAGETILGESAAMPDGSLVHRLVSEDGREHVVARSVWS